MKRLHVHVSVDDLARATDFYAAMLGAPPAHIDTERATWRLDARGLDLTIAADGGEPGLDRLGIGGDTEQDLVDIHRRLGAATLTTMGPAGAGGPVKADANRAVDPLGLVWEFDRPCTASPAPLARATGVLPFADAAPGEPRALNILFMCTGNSARSIMAEAIMNRLGQGRFRAFSAGSMPKGQIHPEALGLLERMNHQTDELRSKDWEEFQRPGAPKLDFVFTLCDNAASEICPIWPGQPMSAHWGLPDPVVATGNPAEVAVAFADSYRMLDQRIGIFVNLPIASLDRLSLQRRLDRIGRSVQA